MVGYRLFLTNSMIGFNQRDPNFDTYLSIGDKKDKSSSVIFENYSSGVKTNRDAWCYNLSKQNLEKNISSMIDSIINKFAIS